MNYIFPKYVQLREKRIWKSLAWLCLLTLFVVCVVSVREIIKRDSQIKLLKQVQSQRYLVWQIDDETCFNQLTNSNDGIIRIKFNK